MGTSVKMGTLKGGALRRVEQVFRVYFYGINHSGIYKEIYVNENDSVPIDISPLEIERMD